LKKNIQRQQGLLITKSIDHIKKKKLKTMLLLNDFYKIHMLLMDEKLI